jgi:hypothetical protein
MEELDQIISQLPSIAALIAWAEIRLLPAWRAHTASCEDCAMRTEALTKAAGLQ